MRITKIAHASILIEAAGKRILSDPWWRGPCFGAQWWLHPEPHLEPLGPDKPVDFIYISHGHHDHFHPGTLVSLPRSTPVLVSKHIDLADAVRGLGFPVIALGDDEEYELSPGLRCRILRTHHDDTLMAVTDGKETCLNLNDALHSAPAEVQDRFIARLRGLYPDITYVFCGYGTASHFPNCYDIRGVDRAATAAARQAHWISQWARIVHGLAPRFGFPFAADAVFYEEDLFWANEPVHNPLRPTDAFLARHPGSPTQVLDIASGFVIDGGDVVADARAKPVSNRLLALERRTEIAQANRVRSVSRESAEEIASLLRRNIAACAAYLAGFRGDYGALVRLRGAGDAIAIRKRGDAIDVSVVPDAPGGDHDVVYLTRYAYLKKSLTDVYGSEILFIGSGGIFSFPDPGRARRKVHEELRVMLAKPSGPLPPRKAPPPAPVALARKFLKRMAGRAEADLYDISSWVVPE